MRNSSVGNRPSGPGLGLALFGLVTIAAGAPAEAIDVKLSMEEAKKSLAAGREPMEKAESPDDVKKVLQQSNANARVGADPEKDPCGPRAILRTKRYRLEAYGRQEATESKKQKKDVRMPDEFIQKVIAMPTMEIEVQLCGDDEYFAEGAEVAFQQGSKTVKPIDTGKAERGRKNDGQGPAYRSRFTARFDYDSFDPNAKTKVLITFPDGKMSEFDADLSKVK